MKKIYFLIIIISSLLFTNCSKDFLKPYEERIIGTWHISDVNRIGIGGTSSNLPFRQGIFQFNNDGSLVFTDDAGHSSNGYWEIDKRWNNNNVIRTLHITTVDFATQQIRAELYDEMHFRSTNHFVANINQAFHTYVTHFRR